jgi:hypothetical protein
MSDNTVKFYFIKTGAHEGLHDDMRTISNQLGAYADSKFGLKINETSITISYNDTDIVSVLSIEPKAEHKDTTISSQMTLACDRSDTVSVNLLKGIVKSMGYRVYNPSISGYSATDPNLLDLTTSDINAKIIKMFEVKKLVPIFQYINTLIFFARDPKDESIHLVNRHLIQGALDSKVNIVDSNDFSVKVASDIATFIALADRGVIPSSFYHRLYSGDKKVYHHNLSGIDIAKVNTNLYLSPVFFYLDRAKQSFVSLEHKKSIDILKKIEKGSSIKKFVLKVVKQNKIEPLIAVKYPNNVQFLTEKNGQIFPRINISIFVDEQ